MTVRMRAFANKMKRQTEKIQRFMEMLEVSDTPLESRTAKQRMLLLSSTTFSSL